MKQEVLEAHIEGLKALIEEKFSSNEKGHDAILIQTTKTNGRVNKLEEWKNQVDGGWNLIKFVGIGNIVLLTGLWIDHLRK